MKHISSDRYTVAWFKLAECVSRGEKERAFGVYRLLSHSLDDRALSLQLEGDLFLAFDMYQEALERYEKAAHKYKQVGRLLEAASVYEHMCLLKKDEPEYKKELFVLYATLQFDVRVMELGSELATIYEIAGRLDAVRALAHTIARLDSFAAQAACYENILYTCMQLKGDHLVTCSFYIEQMIRALLAHGSDTLLQQYMTRLKAHDDTLYQVAVKALND